MAITREDLKAKEAGKEDKKSLSGTAETPQYISTAMLVISEEEEEDVEEKEEKNKTSPVNISVGEEKEMEGNEKNERDEEKEEGDRQERSETASERHPKGNCVGRNALSGANGLSHLSPALLSSGNPDEDELGKSKLSNNQSGEMIIMPTNNENHKGKTNYGFLPDTTEEHIQLQSWMNAHQQQRPSCPFIGIGKSDLENGIHYSQRDEFQLEIDHRNGLKSIRFRLLRDVGSEKIREDPFVKAFVNTELLSKLFSLFDHKQTRLLVQEEWIEFLKSRLNREEKQQDFVEVVESVTYAVCKDADVNFESFCTIFKTKNVLNKLFRLIDRDFDGVVTADQVMDFISQLSSARSSSRLTTENIKWLEKLFRQCVGDGNEIRKEDFNKIIQTKNQFFTERVFEIFDRDSSGSISLQEFLDCMHQFTGQNPDDKIHFLFKVYDVDGDGLIQEAELEQVMTACMEENGMKFSDEQIHELTMALFEDADVEKRGALTYEALKAQLEKHGGLLENLSISIERWLVPPKPRESERSILTKIRSWKPHQLSPRYFRNNYVYLLWLAAFMVTNVALFSYRMSTWKYGHPEHTWWVVVARAAGQCLNFNCTFIVVMMLRQTLTFLRALGASSYIPIDQHIYFHKMTGWLVFIFSYMHAVMHLVNIKEGVMKMNANVSYWEVLVDPACTPTLGLIPGYAFNTGVLLMLILTVMVVCSLPFVRRGGCFEVFYWTHLLYYVFWVLLIVHAPNFWKWFIVPGIIFLVEQVLRFYHWRMGRGKSYIRSGILLPSKVTHLSIKRPPNFDFNPGDYVFVRIPTIAKYEWHPFTISSSPEQEGVIYLHIRAVGEWTNRLYDYFEEEQSKLLSSSGEEIALRTKLPTFVTKAPMARLLSNRSYTSNNFSPPKKVGFEETLETVSSVDSRSGCSGTISVDSSANNLGPNSLEVLNEAGKDGRGVVAKCKPKLESTKSLPNVHERKIAVRVIHSVPQRSLSVQSVDSDSTRPGSHGGGKSGRNQILGDSLRYIRNKPTVISLKTPEFEGYSTIPEDTTMDSILGNNFQEQLAEEGMSQLGNDNKQGFHSFQVTATTDDDVIVGRPLEVYVDGPYGAPSSHIFRAQHAVLVATGIGVTPFASILQSIMMRYWASRVTCPNCDFTWCDDMPTSVFNLKKVDFLWINREQRSFEWFVHLLSQLEIEQAEFGGAMERFLDMHMYITSALQRTDMKAVGLQLALDLLHEKEKRDLITGLKTRTNAGRPNWNKLFKQLADQNKGKITVFYCGPPTLARTLKIKCDEFGFIFRKELF